MAKPALSEVLNNHGLEVDFGLNDGSFFLQLVVCHSASNVGEGFLDGLDSGLIFWRKDGALGRWIGSCWGHAFCARS